MKTRDSVSQENTKTRIYFLASDNIQTIGKLPLGNFIGKLVQEEKECTKEGKLITAFYQYQGQIRKLVIAGVGTAKNLEANKLRRLAGTVARTLAGEKTGGKADVLASFPLTPEYLTALAEGLALGSYSFRECKTTKDAPKPCDYTIITTLPKSNHLVKAADILTKNICMVRDWVNRPSNLLYPEVFANIAKDFAKDLKLSCEILTKKDMEKKKMGAILAVGQGSHHEPRMITLKYEGAGKDKPYIAFVGKGVCFDSGGISLKSGQGMGDMKDDMGGAGAVLGAIKTIAELKLPVNVMAVAGCVENMPGGGSYKPGDVLVSASGKTIEVANTDAEGRIVLADAVWYACEQGAAKVIDLATLTGACLVALGMETAGVITNNIEFSNQVIEAGKKAGESYWQLPSLPDVRELLKADTGDVLNETGRWGGTISAGLFIEEFVKPHTPWVHLDIAGPANTEKALGYWSKGATGFGVATLVQLAKEL
jgi:leucyl aminopeptidase